VASLFFSDLGAVGIGFADENDILGQYTLSFFTPTCQTAFFSDAFSTSNMGVMGPNYCYNSVWRYSVPRHRVTETRINCLISYNLDKMFNSCTYQGAFSIKIIEFNWTKNGKDQTS
jgi:hypothetical protein